jgi:hypothetical protein
VLESLVKSSSHNHSNAKIVLICFNRQVQSRALPKIKEPSWVIKLNGILYEDFDTRFASHLKWDLLSQDTAHNNVQIYESDKELGQRLWYFDINLNNKTKNVMDKIFKSFRWRSYLKIVSFTFLHRKALHPLLNQVDKLDRGCSRYS